MIIRDAQGNAFNLKITVGIAEKLQELGLNLFCWEDAEEFFEKDKSRYVAVVKFLFPFFMPDESFQSKAEVFFNAAWSEFYPEIPSYDIKKIETETASKKDKEKKDIRKSLYQLAGEVGINPREFSAREIYWLAYGAAERMLRLENLLSAFGGNNEILKNKYSAFEIEPGINRDAFELLKGLARGKKEIIKIPKQEKSE